MKRYFLFLTFFFLFSAAATVQNKEKHKEEYTVSEKKERGCVPCYMGNHPTAYTFIVC